MLFRKGSSVSLRDVKYLDIDRQDWTDQCKQSMSMGFQRVLLVSENKPTTHILDEIQRLRQLKGGQKLRCLFTADHVPIKTLFMLETLQHLAGLKITEMTLENEQLFQQVLKADLFMNVFKEGKWGSYHYTQKTVTGHGEDQWTLPRGQSQQFVSFQYYFYY